MLKPPKRNRKPKSKNQAPLWHRHNIREGTIFGWKKAFFLNYLGEQVGVIVKLKIPAEARAVHALADTHYDTYNYREKCRASEAKVIGFYNYDYCDQDKPLVRLTNDDLIAYSFFDKSFSYSLGETIKPKRAFSNRMLACASGIHFFLKKKQAVDYKAW